MKKYLPLVLLGAVVPAKGQWVVSDPVVEQATMAKNAFDQLKYAWEQTQWAQQLSIETKRALAKQLFEVACEAGQGA
jgi:hypothetical protein